MKNKLIIFDFDGVLVETEMTTFKFYQELLPDYGLMLRDEDFHLKAGRKSIDFFRDALGEKFSEELVNELIAKKRKAFLKDVRKYVKQVEGSVELLEKLKKAGFTIAIGSQNEKELIQEAVDVFDIRKYFSFMTSNQDISKKKPDPEVFHLVTKTLNMHPSEAVVIEDSPHGVTAARTGGFKSVGITTAFSREKLSHADHVVNKMKELNPELLGDM